MKKCSVCNKEKPEKEYFYKNKRKQKLHAQCKECYVIKRRKIWRTYYHKHGSEYRERAIARNKIIKKKARKQMMIYLSDKQCVICKNNDPRVLEFDHINPTSKSFSIARALASTYSWNKILTEIKKCQILCANCHKIKTSKESGWYKHVV